MVRHLGHLLAVALLAGACASGATAPAPSAQITVLGDDGNVRLIDVDTGEDRNLTSDAGDSVTYFQPIWSPDGTVVSAARIDAAEGFSLSLIDAASGDLTAAPTPANPFYVSWAPDGSQLAFLSNAEGGGLNLSLVDAAGSAVEEADRGAPYYFTWDPAGNGFAAHVGTERMELRDEAGDVVPLGRPGAFRAPQWIDGGVLFLEAAGAEQRLVTADGAGEVTVLATVSDGAVFSANSTGELIAVLTTRGATDGLSAATSETPRLSPGRLVVLGPNDGEVTTVTSDPVAAFFWDPAGTRLLVLTLDRRDITLTWSVWADGDLDELTSFVPSATFFRDFLPFFDQYAQSMSLWAPDGTRFVFPGTVDGETGIWVQTATGGEPQLVADGTWAAWSP